MALKFLMRTGFLDIRRRPRESIALHAAVFFNRLSEIHKLLENGADIDAKNENGETALHIACRYSNEECIEAFLNYKPCMNVQENTFGMTPLLVLVTFMKQKSSILRKMLNMGADPNLSRKDGNTPLHIIAKDEYGIRSEGIRYAQILLEFKANVNAKNKFHNTPLHEATVRGFKKIIPILLKNGASIKIKNIHGYNPLEFAFKRQKKIKGPLDEIVKYIIIKLSIEKEENKELSDELCRFNSLKLYKDKCDEELLELKSKVIVGSYVTFYDLLISPVHVVAKYLRNRKIYETLILFDEKKYIFGSHIYRIFHEAFRLYEATEIGYKFCRTAFPLILPDTCLDEILQYLTYEDLMKLKNPSSSMRNYFLMKLES